MAKAQLWCAQRVPKSSFQEGKALETEIKKWGKSRRTDLKKKRCPIRWYKHWGRRGKTNTIDKWTNSDYWRGPRWNIEFAYSIRAGYYEVEGSCYDWKIAESEDVKQYVGKAGCVWVWDLADAL